MSGVVGRSLGRSLCWLVALSRLLWSGCCVRRSLCVWRCGSAIVGRCRPVAVG